MSKSVLVIDTPSKCTDCPLFVCRDIEGDYECKIKDYDGLPIYYKEGNIDKPSWCPLSLIPEKVKLKQDTDNTALDMESVLAYQYTQGYNACIQDILKGEK